MTKTLLIVSGGIEAADAEGQWEALTKFLA